MDLYTGVIVFGLLWGIWIIYKIHKRRATRGDIASALVGKPKPEQAEMPRLGKPSTITLDQIKALHQNDFTPDKNWSKEEAALILDSVKYLRAVCRDISSGSEQAPSLEIQNALLRFILTKQDIRDYVRKWGQLRRDEGMPNFAEDEPILDKNGQYDRVKLEAQKYFIKN